MNLDRADALLISFFISNLLWLFAFHRLSKRHREKERRRDMCEWMRIGLPMPLLMREAMIEAAETPKEREILEKLDLMRVPGKETLQ